MNLFSATPSCKLQLMKYSFIVAILIAGISEFTVFIHNYPINQGLDDSYADFSLIVALIVKHHRDDVSWTTLEVLFLKFEWTLQRDWATWSLIDYVDQGCSSRMTLSSYLMKLQILSGKVIRFSILFTKMYGFVTQRRVTLRLAYARNFFNENFRDSE